MDSFAGMTVNLLIFVAILFAAYYTAKYVSKRGNKFAKSRHMKIEDRLILSRDKTVYLIKVGKEYYLVGSTAHKLDVLGKPESIIEEDLDSENIDDIIDKIKNSKNGSTDDMEFETVYVNQHEPRGIAKLWGKWLKLLENKNNNEAKLREYRRTHAKRKDEDS